MDARRWINQKVHDLVELDEFNKIIDETTVIPYIDGGTEGLRGQSRVIIPYKTACLDCLKQLNTNNRNVFALCTIAETPRVPEHCIEYVYLIQWKDHFTRVIDTDSIEDVTWIYNKAKIRAESFGIEGVTYSLTLGVIKNVIPAIASTNAIIAASTSLEALKLLSGYSQVLNNYFMYMGHEGVYANTSEYIRNENCECCSIFVRRRDIDGNMILRNYIEELKKEFGLNDPSIYSGTNIVIISNPDFLREQNEYKMDMTIR